MNIEDIKYKKIAIHIDTEEKFDKFCKNYDLSDIQWQVYGSSTCIRFTRIWEYCYVDWFKHHGYKIISFEQFMNEKQKGEQKQMKHEISKYEFKGEIDIDILVNDAFRDMKRCFIVIGKENAAMAILKNTNEWIDDIQDYIFYQNGKFKTTPHGIIHPYFFKIIEKKDVHNWICWMKEENKSYNKTILKRKDEIAKINKTISSKDREKFKVFMI